MSNRQSAIKQPGDEFRPDHQGGDQSDMGDQKGIRDQRPEIGELSQSAWEPKRIGRTENSERRLQKTDRHGRLALYLIVKVISV
jgi:hypothetical protein